MACRERGMALVSVLVLLAVLLVMAHVLAEKSWQSLRLAAAAGERAQLFWAAQAGIEVARLRLAQDYRSSDGWQAYLAAGTPRGYPQAPAWTCAVNGLTVEIFLRDNADGDDDLQRDNDLKLFVLARALGSQGGEALVESLCGFDLPARAGYAAPAVQAPVGAGTALAALPVSTLLPGD